MKILRKIAVIVLAVFMAIVGYIPYNAAYAQTEENTVLDDLMTDKNFDKNDYPSMSYQETVEKDQELLQLIQLAESDDGFLVLYFYVPTSATLAITATTVNISYGYSERGEGLSPKLYDLQLLSAEGVFAKYLVKGFSVKNDVERYYNVVSVNRKFIDSIDSPIAGSSSSEPGIAIGQQWRCYNLNGHKVYECGKFDVLEIKVKHTGNFEFSSGFKFGNLFSVYEKGKSWFICFDLVDYIANRICDADLSYKIRTFNTTMSITGTDVSRGEFGDDICVTLRDTDTASYDGGGLASKTYTWNRIMTSEAFLTNAKEQKIAVSSECETKLNESQWVFAFTETEMTSWTVDGQFGSTTYIYDYEIADVTILRVHFVSGLDSYDLGVVSSKVTIDNVSDGYGGMKEPADILNDLKEFFGKALGVLGIILFVVILTPILILIFRFVSTVLAWIISAIGSLFKRKK